MLMKHYLHAKELVKYVFLDNLMLRVLTGSDRDQMEHLIKDHIKKLAITAGH
jgi:hypothetical protein